MSDTRVLDTITRIYKNAIGDVIGIHCISIVEERASVSPFPGDYPDLDERRKRGVQINSSFTTYNLAMSGSRTINSVLMFGKYDTYTLNGGSTDIVTVTYYGRDDEDFENDLIISMDDFPTIGETV